MSRVVRLVLIAGVLVSSPAWAQYPTTPPNAVALRPFQIPAPQEATLPNGLRLVVVENHEQPVFSLSLTLVAGSKRDPAGREGVSAMTADLLTKGTATRSGEQVISQLEAVGATLAAETDADFITLTTTGLAENAGPLADIVADVAMNSTYPAAAFDDTKKRYYASIERDKNDPQAIADRVFARTLFGEHPYGRRATVTSVQAVTREDVAKHATTWFKPGNALLVLAGDLTLAQARQIAQKSFGNWRGTAPAVAATPAPRPGPTRIRLVNKPGAVQTGIVMGNLGLAAADPRQYAALVANRILGGGNDSRLVADLRNQKRWSPDAHSEIGRRQDMGNFTVTAGVRAQVSDQALSELSDQVQRFRTEAVPDSELTRAKNSLIGSFPRQVETVQQLAGQVATAKLMGLSDDYLRTFREKIAAVTSADVMAAAKAAMHPDSAVVVLAGDGKALYEKLKTIAPVDIVDPDGKALAAEDLTPKPGPLSVDKSQFVTRKDSFVVILNNNPLGTFTTEIVAQGDSLTYHENLAIPVARWNLDTKARLSLGSMEMKTLDQIGSMSNQAAETHLVYGGGRVKGRAQIPQQGGTPKATTIDTTVAIGVVDAGALPLVVPGLPLEPQTSYTIFAFDAASAKVTPVQVTVMAIGNLGVPAGIFPVSQVQVMGPQPLVLYITRDTPRRVVKVERMGQPMSFELVK